MLAALIATRIPPVPPAIFYGNQFVAATTTFTLIGLTTRAAFLSTNPAFSYQLMFSRQGQESILDQLNRYYYRIVNYLSSDANMVNPAPFQRVNSNDLYLSNQIAGVIATALQLNTIVQALPVAAPNAVTLLDIQKRMTIALRLLQSLAIPITLNYS